MKLLNEDEMVQLFEASEADREFLRRRMHPVCDPDTQEWFAANVQKSHYNITTIVKDQVKVGCIWWWFSKCNKTVVFKAGASFVQTNTTDYFERAYALIAKSVCAVAMEIETRRPGVIKLYRKNGWHIQGISLRKILW